MSWISAMGEPLKHAMGPVLGLGLTAYFLFHAIEGERGIIAYSQLTDAVAEISELRDQVRSERERLTRDVEALRSESLDRDLLEERARAMLDYAHADELVIFHQTVTY